MWVFRGEASAPIPPRGVASLCVDWCRILGLRCFSSFPLEQARFLSNPHTETPGMKEFGVFSQRLEVFLLCIRKGFKEVGGICYFSLLEPLSACMYLSLWFPVPTSVLLISTYWRPLCMSADSPVVGSSCTLC